MLQMRIARRGDMALRFGGCFLRPSADGRVVVAEGDDETFRRQFRPGLRIS
jgi:hypothetical protein